MNRRGVSYDVGRVLGGNWRPSFDEQTVRRELEIIRADLHCTAVRICGLDLERIAVTARFALDVGLEVWLSPELWDKDQRQTLAYLERAASIAEALRQRSPDRVVLSVASEATLFTRGILEGRWLMTRLRNKRNWATIDAGGHNEPLNGFLARAVDTVRPLFRGPLTYASLPWERVDWSRFDIVGVDHYRDERVRDRYVEMLQPLMATGKPVVITEVGCRTYQGAEKAGAMGFGIVDVKTQALNRLPLVGRFVRARIKGHHVRDEELQARELGETLRILDGAGVEGVFVMTFVEQLMTRDDDARFDLDMSAMSLVSTLRPPTSGTTYPDMPWEPKRSFSTVAEIYAESATGRAA
jgi:hypothetical protein